MSHFVNETEIESKELCFPSFLKSENEEDGTRRKMRDYWVMHCADNPTNDTMMLMNDASEIDHEERKEIVSMLPKYTNKEVACTGSNICGQDVSPHLKEAEKKKEIVKMSVLKGVRIGLWIGRFTKSLAMNASKVVAVDFMQVCIDKNEETVGQIYKNVQYICKDVTELSLENQQFYFVFSNWLMMYLNDKETEILAQKMFDWTKPGVYVFFFFVGVFCCCFCKVNPTFYRKHLFYTTLFSQWDDLELLKVCRVKCYEEMKNKTNQYIWLFQKKMTTATIENESLDN
ncbi:phosphoethanolamine N-methyltransferase 2 (NMT2) [Reticulomyxa filosa]|uniref:phosphoethanolamine N-methyltransferase n=1 Tax=Reticulomyxa filosa TaxID=46433 RepID=X6PCV5_RETFI|nr:phosphoethanolamine N-methyltransferase 2 (NMT2) [Reticulomyxa filosa]|eukprot:ETO35874.1 phosphoethanolamine N-methyltransferase 2 (NMT2) [Reticulomyxa filosa]